MVIGSKVTQLLKIKKDDVLGVRNTKANHPGTTNLQMKDIMQQVEVVILRGIIRRLDYRRLQVNPIFKVHLEGKDKVYIPTDNLYPYSLAMKHHPDRFSEPEKKQAAKTKFQVISSAYSVLRDGKK